MSFQVNNTEKLKIQNIQQRNCTEKAGRSKHPVKKDRLAFKRQPGYLVGRLTPGWHKEEDSVFQCNFFQFSKFFKNKSFSNHIFSIKSLSKSISFHTCYQLMI